MALNLRAQLAAAQTAYLDNADYDEENDVAKAKAFSTACRKLLLLLPRRTRHAARFELEIDTSVIPAELRRVEEWITDAATSGADGVRAFSLEHFRP